MIPKSDAFSFHFNGRFSTAISAWPPLQLQNMKYAKEASTRGGREFSLLVEALFRLIVGTPLQEQAEEHNFYPTGLVFGP